MCDQGGSGGSTEGVKGVAPKSDVDAASGEGGQGVAQGVRGSAGGSLRCPRDNRGFPIEFLWTLRGSSKIRSDPPDPLFDPPDPPPPPPGVRGFILLKTIYVACAARLAVWASLSHSPLNQVEANYPMSIWKCHPSSGSHLCATGLRCPATQAREGVGCNGFVGVGGAPDMTRSGYPSSRGAPGVHGIRSSKRSIAYVTGFRRARGCWRLGGEMKSLATPHAFAIRRQMQPCCTRLLVGTLEFWRQSL